MKIFRLAVTAAALLLSLGATVQAQTTLRIGLAEDPGNESFGTARCRIVAEGDRVVYLGQISGTLTGEHLAVHVGASA